DTWQSRHPIGVSLAAVLPATNCFDRGRRHYSQSTGVGGNRELCVAELAHHSGGVLCAQRLVLALAGWRRLARLGMGTGSCCTEWSGDDAVIGVVAANRRRFPLSVCAELAPTAQSVLFEAAHERELQSLAPGECLWCIRFDDAGPAGADHRGYPEYRSVIGDRLASLRIQGQARRRLSKSATGRTVSFTVGLDDVVSGTGLG